MKADEALPAEPESPSGLRSAKGVRGLMIGGCLAAGGAAAAGAGPSVGLEINHFDLEPRRRGPLPARALDGLGRGGVLRRRFGRGRRLARRRLGAAPQKVGKGFGPADILVGHVLAHTPAGMFLAERSTGCGVVNAFHDDSA